MRLLPEVSWRGTSLRNVSFDGVTDSERMSGASESETYAWLPRGTMAIEVGPNAPTVAAPVDDPPVDPPPSVDAPSVDAPSADASSVDPASLEPPSSAPASETARPIPQSARHDAG